MPEQLWIAARVGRNVGVIPLPDSIDKEDNDAIKKHLLSDLEIRGITIEDRNDVEFEVVCEDCAQERLAALQEAKDDGVAKPVQDIHEV
jgi:hypothetical protein